MEDKGHQYKLTLEYIKDSKGNEMSLDPITLTFGNHDDIFFIVDKLKGRDFFENKQQATELAIGLKLFSEVMLKNNNHALFEELKPAFIAFMKKLKTT